MAGIPPLVGFGANFMYFFAALGSSLYFLYVMALLSSIVSCFYYLRFIKFIYFHRSSSCSVNYLPME